VRCSSSPPPQPPVRRWYGPIVRALETTKGRTLNERFFLDLLQRAFSVDEAPARLDTAINWGRYGELFDYHADSTELGLTQPE
jgi:NitT/TauT family transport system ATP-binding protein